MCRRVPTSLTARTRLGLMTGAVRTVIVTTVARLRACGLAGLGVAACRLFLPPPRGVFSVTGRKRSPQKPATPQPSPRVTYLSITPRSRRCDTLLPHATVLTPARFMRAKRQAARARGWSHSCLGRYPGRHALDLLVPLARCPPTSHGRLHQQEADIARATAAGCPSRSVPSRDPRPHFR